MLKYGGDKNKEREYNKKYYELNREKYIGDGKYNEKKLCEKCNKSYSILNFSKHLKTKKHLSKL